MAFCDLLRVNVLLTAGSATVLAAVTVISATSHDDTLTLLVAAGWWTIAVIAGLIYGSPRRSAEGIEPLLTQARTSPTLPPQEHTGRAALARVWPIGMFALLAGGLGFAFPGVAAIGTGFALGAALLWRGRDRAVSAIEERDGVRFYVEPGSALQPVKLIRSPGLRRDRPPPGHPPPPPAAAG